MPQQNPFKARIPESVPSDPAAFNRFGVLYAADALWDLLAELPNKAEATLAQRRLEESVFWAERAVG